MMQLPSVIVTLTWIGGTVRWEKTGRTDTLLERLIRGILLTCFDSTDIVTEGARGNIFTRPLTLHLWGDREGVSRIKHGKFKAVVGISTEYWS